ncbi:MAG: hypothetical protein HRU09_00165 [Oligoflexales bacterium]|nr:hypothetical protein [Oligoflexales bacterium]
MLRLRETKVLGFILLLFMGACSNQSDFVKIDSSGIDDIQKQDDPQNYDAEAEAPIKADETTSVDDPSSGISDLIADLDLPQEAMEENMEEGTESSEIESPIMITGAYILSCDTIDEQIECVAEVDPGFDIASIEILDHDGKPIPLERIELVSSEESGKTKLVIRVSPEPTPMELEPELSEQELCEMKEGFIWEAESNP